MTQDTIKNLLPKFIESLKVKGRSPATILAYRSDLEQLTGYLLKRERATPDQVKPEDLDSFRDQLLADKYTPKSVSRKLNAVKTFFRWMITENAISFDPSSSVAHPKIDNALPKFLSQLEYRALRDVVRNDVRIAAIVELILQTGLRISEVANLKIERSTDGSLKIESYATQPERTAPLNKPAQEVLDSYMKIRPKSDSPYVFISKNGKPLAVRNIRASISRYMQRAELPSYSVNDLRTTFMVENLKAGVDIVLLSQVSGHKRLSTTERYLELAQITEPGKKQTLIEL
ncbi:MAG: tyrosine recombinase XerC, integrase/recombinase XerC [Microgenomates group bacterium GW2011_GWC1_39_7b]|uniref:Tyrosine recombinase XerC n=3 Tax=Candidatus Woeseibacteriota TaxID=1752722 RepID=A0A0G0UU68_9BACT|nr:MAG: Tyrosine recombinase XerC [Candidatus Woesebacteria bacterium GW2011_GWB1_39_10]KKR26161.1 MAG: tyrosine recombinase XerC, integrase/recombinase XerC [Microgenomates group bacterium GW2011_GWC1_39_7b]KKR72855.1 MAG: Tyrosine recombinase XerC [Candidatus Woesebacteria bacterium GW2011_GWA2_40_7]KKR92253.1 MAG: Tyrosine recombinase XerC [Candidatus Woesebacteria bacterium GW2011_GWA1_41_13b]